jgi:hypothetical protein
MNNPSKFFQCKEFLLKKEAFIHNPGDKLNIIPWLLLNNKHFSEQIIKDETFIEKFLDYSYDYVQLPILKDFKTS